MISHPPGTPAEVAALHARSTEQDSMSQNMVV